MKKIYEKSISELFTVFVDSWKENNGIFKKDDVIKWFDKNYKRIKTNAISVHLVKLSVNDRNRIHYNVHSDGRDDLIFKLDKDQNHLNKHAYRKYDKIKDPLPIYKPIIRKPDLPIIGKPNNDVIDPSIETNISAAFEILYSHREEIEQFMNFYIFKRMKISKDNFIENTEDFLLFIEFCLNTAQRPQTKNIKAGLDYFKKRYLEIRNSIIDKNISNLKSIIYESPGIGQKIGSMILEFIYLYSNKRDNEIAKNLFVPLDTHVLRLFKDSFHLKNIPKNISDIHNNGFIGFQKSLEKYTNGKPIIYFDYLWFIGKMFCNKINEENRMNRGYKLCKYCWICKYCQNDDKWILK